MSTPPPDSAADAQQQTPPPRQNAQAGGDVYQAGRDVIVTLPPPAKSWLDHWAVWLGLAAAVATVLIAVLDLPAKWTAFPWPGRGASAEVTGVVWDGQNHPVAGAKVLALENGEATVSGPTGAFRLDLRGAKEARLLAEKPGYTAVPQYVSAGATVDLTLRENKPH